MEGFIVVLWIMSAIAGAFASADREAALMGFFLGLILGPIGAIAALGLDGRYTCPRCRGRLDGRGEICQHCGQEFVWVENRFGGPSLYAKGQEPQEMKLEPAPDADPKATVLCYCPACSREHAVPREKLGAMGRCPCGQRFRLAE